MPWTRLRPTRAMPGTAGPAVRSSVTSRMSGSKINPAQQRSVASITLETAGSTPTAPNGPTFLATARLCSSFSDLTDLTALRGSRRPRRASATHRTTHRHTCNLRARSPCDATTACSLSHECVASRLPDCVRMGWADQLLELLCTFALPTVWVCAGTVEHHASPHTRL